ncbi:MAG: hypothetical protein IKG08_05255 [Eubacterium sp.]|nr:hypothetical protein [Eubacterium sp.]
MKPESTDLIPYEGDKPYMFFCFSDADAAKIRPLLARLYARGVRIWYHTGKSSDMAERAFRQQRMKGAALTVLYLTDAARADLDMKSDILSCQARGCPVICIDTDTGDSGLSMGLTDAVRHIQAYKGTPPEDTEEKLIRTEGFTQELVGEPRQVSEAAGTGSLVKVLLVIAAVMIAAGIFLAIYKNRPKDTVSLTDPVIEEAVREACDSGVLTEEILAGITVLRLSAVPEQTDDLALLPSLVRLEIPLEDAAGAEKLLESGLYEIALYKGGGS